MPVEGRAVSKIQLVAVPKDGVQAVLKVEELEGCEHRTYDDSNDNGDDDDDDGDAFDDQRKTRVSSYKILPYIKMSLKPLLPVVTCCMC